MARLLAAAWRGRALTAENYAAYFRGLLALEEEQIERDIGQYAQVRKTPSWPRSWANFSLSSCIPTGMHGQLASFGPT